MFKVTGFKKDKQYNKIMLETDNGVAMHIILDGHLEAYMGAYDIPAGVALMMILSDAHMDDITAPFMDDADATKKAKKIARDTDSLWVWEVDRNEVLAQITIDADTAEMLKTAWAAARDESVTETPDNHIQAIRKRLKRSEEYGKGHKRREEELSADDIVAANPHMKRTLRDTTSGDVGLSVKYI